MDGGDYNIPFAFLKSVGINIYCFVHIVDKNRVKRDYISLLSII